MFTKGTWNLRSNISWRCPFKVGLLILVFHYLTCVNLGDSPTFVSRWRVLYTEWDWREWPWRGRRVGTRETRERWPLLTVETEVNRDSKSTNERSPSLVGSLGLLCRYTRFFFCLGFSRRPSKKYFFLTLRFFDSFVPTAQQAGLAAVLGHLSLSMCLWLELPPSPNTLRRCTHCSHCTSSILAVLE